MSTFYTYQFHKDPMTNNAHIKYPLILKKILTIMNLIVVTHFHVKKY